MSGSVRIVTSGQTLTVNITRPDGSAATAYTDGTLSSSLAFPQVITADTSYYFNTPCGLVVSTKLSGTEIAGGLNVTVPVFVEDGQQRVLDPADKTPDVFGSTSFPTASTLPLRGIGGRFRNLTILTYHAISSLATFQTDCNFYQEWNYTTVTFDDVWNHLQGTSTLPSKPLLITFDDGYASQYQAFQELNTRGMKGTLFAATDWIDGTQTQAAGGFLEATPLTWTQVNQAKAWGIDIQAHTKTHVDLTTVSAATVASEYSAAKADIESRVAGQVVHYLAYPYGAWNSTVTTALAGAGCRLARVVRIAADGTFPGANLGRYAIASTLHGQLALPTAGTGNGDIQQPNYYRTLDPDAECCPDYGFEAGGKGWSLGSGFSVTTDQPHSGVNSLKCVQGTSTVSSTLLRLIPVGKWSRLQMKGYIFSTLPAGNYAKVQLQVLKYDDSVYATIDAGVVTGPAGWTPFTYEFIGDQNASAVKIFCVVQGNVAPSGAAWFDDISVKRECLPSPYLIGF